MNHKLPSDSCPDCSNKHFLFLILLASFAWICAFLPFLSTHIRLFSDAASYYEHTKFFIDNLCRGVYPLWDPYWNYGVPNEFFLRRIGPFNPFMLLILFLVKTGLSFGLAYRIYLAVYFLFGMYGFYLLAKRVLNDRKAAFLAFILLLFSALGTRLFDAYMHLMIVPIIWFFYFLLSFQVRPSRFAFYGMVLVVMNILTTYMPFYFMVVLGAFLIFAAVVYFRQIPRTLSLWSGFFRKHFLVTLIGITAVSGAFLPGISLYKQTAKSQLVLPERHSDLTAKNQLGVNVKDSTNWELLADLVYGNYYFHDLTRYRISVFYVSPFLLLFLCLGLWSQLNRKLLLLFLWGMSLALLSAPFTNSSYLFLRQYIFFFKYFKNLHFFLWIAILPIAIICAAELFRQVSASLETRKWTPAWISFIFGVHLAMLIMLLKQDKALVSSYLALALSFVFFILTALGFFRGRGSLALLWILFMLGLEPVHVYSQYFLKNAERDPLETPYDNISYLDFHFRRAITSALPLNQNIDWIEKNPAALYIATPYFYALQHNLNWSVLESYLSHRLIVYDKTEYLPDDPLDIPRIGKNFYENTNAAFLSQNTDLLNPEKGHAVSSQVLKVPGNSEALRIVSYDVNTLVLKTNFDSAKYFVYNDAYHPGWSAWINGSPAPLIRSNVAFKGLRIPPGPQLVKLRYRSIPDYLIEIFLLLLSNLLFVIILIWGWKDGHLAQGLGHLNEKT